jgi:acyl-coenzyme A thioesterase PaaI-like protein
MQKKNKIKQLAKSPWKMKFYMLMNLPMGFIAGLKITEITSVKAQITVPYKFVNKNPFKSMYFAVQAMAAELSSGILALSEVSEAKKPISMLVLNLKASFTKKARTKVSFNCNDGDKIRTAIAESIRTGEGQTVDVKSVGIDKEGDQVAEFTFTWTFKPKK